MGDVTGLSNAEADELCQKPESSTKVSPSQRNQADL